jgi:hypothetical protein
VVHPSRQNRVSGIPPAPTVTTVSPQELDRLIKEKKKPKNNKHPADDKPWLKK